jgi:hypothetical protein
MESFTDHVYNIIEFVAFIVPRVLQFVLDAITHLNWMDSRLAMNMYIGMSYACAAALLTGSFSLVRRSVHSGVLVVGKQTAWVLIGALVLSALAAFTAAAPSTGLSLKYCAKAIAGFVTFEPR